MGERLTRCAWATFGYVLAIRDGRFSKQPAGKRLLLSFCDARKSASPRLHFRVRACLIPGSFPTVDAVPRYREGDGSSLRAARIGMPAGFARGRLSWFGIELLIVRVA